tara:strand:+ start:30 stop:1178 length:1149 start_codon:yes stop_codon:yes gene_type:complete
MEIFDIVHGPIKICEDAKRIIDTPEFQRLRNIKQLGCVSYVFPCAIHSRFEHSIGVYHLSKKYMNILNNDYFTDTEYKLISLSALIHDLGHGPFSHLFDNFVGGKNHEYRSIELFKYMNQKYNFGYSDKNINFIKDVIDPPDIYMKDKKYCYQIVSNKNGIDVDRMDYIMRDTKMTGLNYGVEYKRIMKNSIIHNSEIYFSNKAQVPIEDFLRIRFILHNEIYNHPTVRSVEFMIKEILELIDDDFKIKECISNENWNNFILITDHILDTINILKYDPENTKIIKAKKIINDIKERKIYKLIGEIIHSKPFHINMNLDKLNNIIIDHSKITYYSEENPKYINKKKSFKTFRNGFNHDHHILKIFSKDKNNQEAINLYKSISL